MQKTTAAAILVAGIAIVGAAEQGRVVDPFEVVAAFDRAAEMKLWPGFNATAYPIAIYDGERTLLMRHPGPPDGFTPLEGHAGTWVFAGKHPAMRWNSNAEIGGIQTATLLLTIEPGRPVDYEAHILFHEIFHLYSKPLHPSWRPDEVFRYSYPMDDVRNYRLLLEEEEALARAMESETDEDAASWTALGLAIRTRRMADLSEEHRTFETALELQEGTAVYMGRSTLGTERETTRLREERGPDGIRWRCYESGAAIAVVLDRLLPSWKKDLDARPETTFSELLSTALAGRDTDPATFTGDELAEFQARAESSLADLERKRTGLYEDFSHRGRKVVVRLADENDALGLVRFDPMAVEVLSGGEALQAHQLVAKHPRGELSMTNPLFVRRSLDGVIALTAPAGDHPFLEGFREVTFSGFSDEPKIVQEGSSVTVTAEGLKVAFDAARLERNGEDLIVTVLPAEPVE